MALPDDPLRLVQTTVGGQALGTHDQLFDWKTEYADAKVFLIRGYPELCVDYGITTKELQKVATGIPELVTKEHPRWIRDVPTGQWKRFADTQTKRAFDGKPLILANALMAIKALSVLINRQIESGFVASIYPEVYLKIIPAAFVVSGFDKTYMEYLKQHHQRLIDTMVLPHAKRVLAGKDCGRVILNDLASGHAATYEICKYVVDQLFDDRIRREREMADPLTVQPVRRRRGNPKGASTNIYLVADDIPARPDIAK